MVILAALIFVGLPIAGTVVSGLAADLSRILTEPLVWRAILTSLILGAGAAAFSLVVSLGLVMAREYLATARRYAPRSAFERALDLGASLIMVVPPIVIGAGWFILSRHFVDPFSSEPPQPDLLAARHCRMEQVSAY